MHDGKNHHRNSARAESPTVEPLETRRLLAAGDLDLTFGGGDGLTTFSTQPGSQIDRGLHVAVDYHGRIVALGRTTASNAFGTPGDIVVARFTPQGDLDTTFGPGNTGFVTHNSLNVDVPVDLAVQPDGRILVAFRNAGAQTWAVLRLTENGAPDPTFGGGDGVASHDFGTETIVRMALQPDGKIVTVGSATNFTTGVKGAVVRMRDDGTLDDTFHGDGIATALFGPTGFTEFFDVALDGGRVVAIGRARAAAGQFDRAAIARFTPLGEPDADFGAAGQAEIAVPSTHVLAHSVAVDSASRVSVAVQHSTSTLLTPLPLNLYRLTDAGATDTSFNAAGPTPGRIEVPAASFLSVDTAELLVQSDGKLLFGGAYADQTANAFNVIRINTDGTLDDSFAGDGSAKLTPTAPLASVGADMALDALGRLVINGFVAVNPSSTGTDYDFAIIRVETGLQPPADPVTLTAGVLRIRGTDADDTVLLRKSGNDFLATLNGQLFTFPAADVTSLDVELFGGNDHQTHDGGVPGGRIDLGGGLTNSVTLNTGNRADALLQIFGGAGNDTVELKIAAFTPVFFDGGQDDARTDYLIYHGSTGNDAFNVTASRIDNGGFYEAEFANVDTHVIHANFGFDTFRVTSASGIYDLHGGEGNDAFDLVNGPTNTLVGSINIFGGAGNDAFTFDDSAGGSTQGATILADVGRGNFNGHGVDFTGVETLRYVNGPAGHPVFVSPSTVARVIVDGGGPSNYPGDRLTIDPNSAPTSHTRTSIRDGLFTFAGGKQPIEYKNFERVVNPLDATKPTGTPSFTFANRQSVIVNFSEDVYHSIDTADLVLTNLTTGQVINPTTLVRNTTIGVNAPTRVEWTTFFAQPLPDGNYRATIAADAVRDYADNPLADPISFDFFIFAGDADRNRIVDFNDLVKLAQNYNTVGNKTFPDGDFNYDHNVDFNDLVLLAQNYNKTLPPHGGSPPVVAAAAATAPVEAKAQTQRKAIFSTKPVAKPAALRPKTAPARRA